ncbi:MAG: hypothetical protein HQK76_05680 [Desulfobacterales bacterium]|nr:hypothetical protein [Desulfobacterales bacterium]
MTIDKRAFNYVKQKDIITHWVYKDERGMSWNVIVSYTKEEEGLVFTEGPYQTGHWGHQVGGQSWPIQKAIYGEFPKWAHIPEGAKEHIKQFLQKNFHHYKGFWGD